MGRERDSQRTMLHTEELQCCQTMPRSQGLVKLQKTESLGGCQWAGKAWGTKQPLFCLCPALGYLPPCLQLSGPTSSRKAFAKSEDMRRQGQRLADEVDGHTF